MSWYRAARCCRRPRCVLLSTPGTLQRRLTSDEATRAAYVSLPHVCRISASIGRNGLHLRTCLWLGTDAEGLVQDLGHIEHPHVLARPAVGLLGSDGVRQHHHAEWAGGRDQVRIESERLLGAFDVDPLADLLLDPEAGTTGAAAEAAFLAAVHLLRLQARDGAENLARRCVDLVVPAEVARIVIGDQLVDRLDRREPSLGNQAAEQLRVVHDLEVTAELRVLVGQGVEAVRAGRDDLQRCGTGDRVQGFDVLHPQHLEQELVPQPPGRVAGARLARAEDGELDTGDVHQLGERTGDLLGTILQRTRAADPEQVVDVGVEFGARLGTPDLEGQIRKPLLAAPLGHAPRVALVLEVAQHHTGLGRERRLDQHLVATHVDNVVDVLDVHRALLDAGATGAAGPQHVRVDDSAAGQVTYERPNGLVRPGPLDAAEAGFWDVSFVALDAGVGRRRLPADEVGRLREQVIAQIHDHELRRQRLARVPRRALRLAATAFG